jgi:predicted short-subunit dehydrogenase-like oxidoreductase (DUF2520 family)
VPDPAVAEVAAALPPAASGSAAVHLSGALGLTPLRAARQRGWRAGSLHPLQSFAAERDPDAFRGIAIAVDASDPELLSTLEDLALALGGTPHHVADAARARYHAAAVLASNYVVALVAVAADLLVEVGWGREAATAALAPLVRGVADNLAIEGLPAALTGPIARGDAETVRWHLAGLADRHARVYRIVGLAALDLAREAGLDEQAARRIEEALTG